MDPSRLYELAQDLDDEADCVRSRFDDDRLAALCETHAREVRECIDEWLNEPLTLQQAAVESGYSADRLGRLVRDGTLPNAGERGSPRIRRRNLPRKPSHQPVASNRSPANGDNPAVPSRSQVARTVVESD